jgi:hypothetical protein
MDGGRENDRKRKKIGHAASLAARRNFSALRNAT